jgi:hypothetical protein
MSKKKKTEAVEAAIAAPASVEQVKVDEAQNDANTSTEQTNAEVLQTNADATVEQAKVDEAQSGAEDFDSAQQPSDASTPLSDREKAAKDLFERYPKRDKIFFTSDGLSFFEHCDAQNHAVGLRDKALETITKQNRHEVTECKYRI